jgi:hypothetical protein
MGYVFAACANLGVGGSTESWKTVFGEYLLATFHRTFANMVFSTYQTESSSADGRSALPMSSATVAYMFRTTDEHSVTDTDCKLNSGSQLACPSA